MDVVSDRARLFEQIKDLLKTTPSWSGVDKFHERHVHKECVHRLRQAIAFGAQTGMFGQRSGNRFPFSD